MMITLIATIIMNIFHFQATISWLKNSGTISGQAQKADRHAEDFGPGYSAHASVHMPPCQAKCLVPVFLGKHASSKFTKELA